MSAVERPGPANIAHWGKLEATAQVCPASPHGDTHHLAAPLLGGSMRCAYCGQSQAQLSQPPASIEPACPACGVILDLCADQREAAHELRLHLDAAHPEPKGTPWDH